MYYYEDFIPICPKCSFEETHRDSVDIGVGIIYGPTGCPQCGWSQSPEYDISEGKSEFFADGRMIDQYGSLYPKGNSIAIACFRSYLEECEERGIEPVFRTDENEYSYLASKAME